MSPRAASVAFVVLLAVAIAVRLWLLAATPLGNLVSNRLEGLNDEPAHYNYIKALAIERRFPVQTHHALEPGAFDRGDYEYYQPPLFHLMCVPLYLAFGEVGGLHAGRVLAFVLGLLSLWVLARVLARLGCPPATQRLGVLFMAFQPSHAYFTVLISNDALCWLIALLLTHQLLVVLTGAGSSAAGLRPPMPVRLGLLLAAGMLTKSGIAIFFPLVIGVYGYVAWTARRPRLLVDALIAVAIGALLAAPWYARNLAVYGTLLALEQGFGPLHPNRSSLTSIVQTVVGTVRYWWLPMAHVPGGELVHWIRAAGGALVVTHVGLALWHLRRVWRDPGVALMTVLMAMAIAAHMSLNLKWAEAEGRFLLPAAAPLAYFFVQPVLALAGRWKHGEAIACAYLCLLSLHAYVLLAFVPDGVRVAH